MLLRCLLLTPSLVLCWRVLYRARETADVSYASTMPGTNVGSNRSPPSQCSHEEDALSCFGILQYAKKR
jgi:hypothetical protein